jgi:large subunit ribosomal protein L18e
MKSNSTIEKQLQRKKDKEIVETIIAAKKNKSWLGIASILVGPRRNRTSINLEEIDKEIKDGETVVIPGKVLSQGYVNKKLKVVALNFSEKAKEKLLNTKCEVSNILDEIKKNPQAKNIKILKK